jgi:hypothetical protein
VKGCFGFLLFSTKETFFLKEKKIIFREGGKVEIDGGEFGSIHPAQTTLLK